jgi:ribosomal protein S18 acetylase RimI-like enzyme
VDIRLVEFEERYADAVIGWMRSSREAAEWASLAPADVDRRVFSRWHAEAGVVPCMGVVGDAACAYGEVWEDHDEGEAELARIIVAPHRRGRGIGRQFVSLLVDEGERRGFSEIWLRVAPENAPAIACYAAAGFVRATAEQEAEFNTGQPRIYEWMRFSGRG